MGLKFTNYKPAFVDVTEFKNEEYIHSKEDFYRRFPKDEYTKLNYVYTPIVVDGVLEKYTLKEGDWILGFFYKDFNKEFNLDIPCLTIEKNKKYKAHIEKMSQLGSITNYLNEITKELSIKEFSFEITEVHQGFHKAFQIRGKVKERPFRDVLINTIFDYSSGEVGYDFNCILKFPNELTSLYNQELREKYEKKRLEIGNKYNKEILEYYKEIERLKETSEYLHLDKLKDIKIFKVNSSLKGESYYNYLEDCLDEMFRDYFGEEQLINQIKDDYVRSKTKKPIKQKNLLNDGKFKLE